MVTLVLGGARSGKSSYAQALAKGWPSPVVVIATAEPLDEEMRSRIEAHRRLRPEHWTTLECPRRFPRLASLAPIGGVVVDCLTLWASNRLLERPEAARLAEELCCELEGFVDEARQLSAELVLVSNEVGMGIVPDNPLGRAFRDVLGALNQRAATAADRVVFMVAGLPLTIKG